jgi:trimeric autotransporter adhesin
MTDMRPRSFPGAIALALAALIGVSTAGAVVAPREQPGFLDSKEFFRPELTLTSANVALEQVEASLPNRTAWQRFRRSAASLAAPGHGFAAFIDPRSGAATNVAGAFPLIPGNGVGNDVTLAALGQRLGRAVSVVDEAAVADAVALFLRTHQGALGIDAGQLGTPRASRVNDALWHVSIPQSYRGLPVRYGRVAATIVQGNLVTLGSETWGRVAVDPQPAIDADQAVARGFEHAEGRVATDMILRKPELEVVPVAPPQLQRGEAYAGPVGGGYGHRLVWTYVFQRPPDDAAWEVMVDAHSGEVIAFQDVNHYAREQVKGGVYPLTSTEICPNAAQCGTMQTGWPMPFADTGLAAPNNFTNSGGIFDYTSGAVTTTLTGQYVDISDTCGAISQSGSGTLDLGGTNGQHDCTSGGGSAGNTPASRAAFYEVNKIAELARGWLPANTWLRSRLTTNVNLNNTCNAFYSTLQGTINFYRSGGGCRNTGEIAAVFDHEWGHGLDDNDSGGALSNSSEGYADIAGIFRLNASCVGHGFFWTLNDGCGQTADGTGFNVNESQTGVHCATDCSGVRDSDWDKHSDHQPDTALGFVCGQCGSGTGPCGRQVHCAAAPVRQAAWDLVKRDLAAAPFNLDTQTALTLGNKLFYHGSGNVGSWFACTCGSSSNGCASTNGYMQWLAADDDNGSLADGTPHMTAIFNAFNRHGIACATPAPANSGCSGTPATPALTGTAGEFSSSLSWNAVSGASRYWVFRTEGHAGCELGKALIADLSGSTTSFTDTQVAAGRDYFYNVAAVGSSTACFSGLSSCVTVTPEGGGGGCIPTENPEVSCSDGLDNDCDGFTDLADSDCQTSCLPRGASCTSNTECCSGSCKGKPGRKTCK